MVDTKIQFSPKSIEIDDESYLSTEGKEVTYRFEGNDSDQICSTDTLEKENVSNEAISDTFHNLDACDEKEEVLFYEQARTKDENGNERLVYKQKSMLIPKVSDKLKVEKYLIDDNEVITPKTYTEYLASYKMSEQRSALETLLMCRNTYEAEKCLDSALFSDYCKAIGYKDSSSVIRKQIIIGKLQPRLIKYAEVLPSSWSSIYLLTQLTAKDFLSLIEMQKSLKEIPHSKVLQLVNNAKKINEEFQVVMPGKRLERENQEAIMKGTVMAKIFFRKWPDLNDWKILEKALNEIEANLPVKVFIADGLKNKFESEKIKKYEKVKLDEIKNIKVIDPESWDFGKSYVELNNPSTSVQLESNS